MKILVVGQGGREHALLQALKDSPSNPELYVYPGSDAMEALATRISIDDLDELVTWMKEEGVELLVAGEEKYLVAGLADKVRAAGMRAWGPVAESAQLEGSKIFAKEFMFRNQVPTGGYEVVNSPEALRAAVKGYPCVLKYDGLAAGKGVAVCTDEAMVEEFIEAVYADKKFGEGEVVVEEFLEGKELSVICGVSDGKHYFFTPARDYKRQLEGDAGPNTGGMGAVASRALIDADLMKTIEETVIQPAVNGLVADQLDYRGFLYFGIMLTPDGPKVLEFNCRFGDPEAQAILPLIDGDFAEFLYEAADGRFDESKIRFDEGWSMCVVLASKNYPYQSGKGEVISGLEAVENVRIYHAGTMKNEQGAYAVNGGRVLAVAGRADTREAVLDAVYSQVPKISFDGAQFRPDIGQMHFED